MPEPKTSPYGSWKSPITSDLIVRGSVGVSQPTIAGQEIYWVEMRPSEGGRHVIVRRDQSGMTTDANPPPFNARTLVHEYGGGDYVVSEDVIYFSNFSDQRLYKQLAGGPPRPITPQDDLRYADAKVDVKRRRLICVREDHTVAGREAINTLVSIGIDAHDSGRVLVQGNDFYSSPRISPDGTRLAWLTWNHPEMPWDGSELWTGDFHADGSLINTQHVAGSTSESIFQPEWSPDGTLYFVSDRTGWWNLHRRLADGEIEAITELDFELGVPQWIFGMSNYAFESADNLICTYYERGISKLASIDTRTRKLKSIDTSYTDITFLRAAPGRAVFRAGSPTEPPSIVRLTSRPGPSRSCADRTI